MGLAALVVYGGWAFAANHGHGLGAAWRAAATQGFVSFTVTFFVTAIMEAVHRMARSRRAQFVLPGAVAVAVAAIYTVALHLWMGTPEIARTVVPVLTIGAVYCFGYSANLVRESAARAGNAAAAAEASLGRARG